VETFGGSSFFDVEVPIGEPDLPPLTPEDEAMVRAWSDEDWAREQASWERFGDPAFHY